MKDKLGFKKRSEISHKIHLVHDLEKYGLTAVSEYRTEEEVEFLQSICDKDYDEVINELKKQFYNTYK